MSFICIIVMSVALVKILNDIDFWLYDGVQSVFR